MQEIEKAAKERVKRDGEGQFKTARQMCKRTVRMTVVNCKRIGHGCELRA